MKKRTFIVLTFLLLLANAGIWLLMRPEFRAYLDPAFWRNLAQVGEVMRITHAYYADGDSVSFDDLRREALRDMVGTLDPFSRYLSEDEYADFQLEGQQQYVGVGVQVQDFDGVVTIMRVFPGSPAAEAGLQPGDAIVTVNDQSTEGETLNEVVSRIKGEQGTTVNLGIQRPSIETPLQLTVAREVVDLPTIDKAQVSEDGVGYIRINEFGTRTGEEFAQALQKLEGEGMQALILDLRDNPGGYLVTAVDVAGEFLEAGQLVTYTRGRGKGTNYEYYSTTPERAGHYPLAILINEASASAAEIVSGALQDWGRATVIGATSVGKGSVQSVIPLSDAQGVKLTTAKYYLPHGATIHEKGVAPDIAVPMDMETRRKLYLQEHRLPGMSREAFTEAHGFEPVQDAQLQRALEWVREQLNAAGL